VRRVLIVALLLAGLTIGAGTADAFRKTTLHPRWVLTESGRGGRSIVVSYDGGGCAGEATARVTETGSAIRVVLDQTAWIPEDGEACTADLRVYRLKVRLAAPVAGRRVRGQGDERRVLFAGPFDPDGQRLVPRMIGLAPADALRALNIQGFEVRTRTMRRCGRRALVVRQSLPAHSRRHSDSIRLAVRRACPRG
jgi:hypothetical protein